MKIYTGAGDRGRTSLFSGERVAKNHSRIEAYGDVDELNSFIGLLAAMLPEKASGVAAELALIQADLFTIGALLAVTPESPTAGQLTNLGVAPSQRLESAIDGLNAELGELNSFILPGGQPAAATAHVARTVCRRAERRLVGLLEAAVEDKAATETLEEILIFLNRLSDYFFMLARYCNLLAGVQERPWRR
jgi:cob(I)alamin adenosyltransferase